MFESIILIGPGTELFPLTNSHLLSTNIPILNKPLLEYNIEFLLPVSKIIYIVILEENIKNIQEITAKYKEIIKIVGIPCYDGIASSISKVGQFITSDNIIVTKGDIITDINIGDVVEKYISSEAFFLSILAETKSENITLGYKGDNLLFYTADLVYEFPDNLFTKSDITLSKELDTVQFYMFRKLILPMFNTGGFGFKQNLLPKIVEDLREVNPVVLYSNENTMISQIKDKAGYLNINRLLKLKHKNENSAIIDKSKQKAVKQYIKKNQLEDFSNILGDVHVDGQCAIINSVLGNGVSISQNTNIFSSVIMGNCKIGENCIIDKCIIGYDVVIQPGSTLIDCVVSSGYHFDQQIQGADDVFYFNK